MSSRVKFLVYSISFVACALALYPVSASAADPSKRFISKDKPVDVTADYITYDKAGGTYLAEGDVVVVQGPFVLKADNLIVYSLVGLMTAAGNVVVIDRDGSTMTADILHYEMEDETVVAIKGRLFYPETNVYISGSELRRTSEGIFEADDAVFTTCDCDDEEGSPSWSLRASSARIEADEFFSAWNAFFYVKSVPVLYSPFMAMTIKKDRQTGFLMPRPAYSDLKGFKLDNAFFWAIAENQDATFFLDLETNRGVGGGAEYRYIRKETSFGDLYLYYFQEDDIDRVRSFREDLNNLSRPLSAEEDRWRLKYNHREIIGGDLVLRADINLVSDDEFFIDMVEKTSERTMESLESSLSISKRWDRYNLVLHARQFDNLLEEEDDDELNMLPVITFTRTAESLLGSPFYLSFDAEYINFEREEGVDGQRLNLSPRLSLSLRPWSFLDLTPSFVPMWTYYDTAGTIEEFDEDRFIYEAAVDLSTTFLRSFDLSWLGIEQLYHTIRPELGYSFIPEVEQEALPQFDSLDMIEAKNLFEFSINMTLAGRLGSSGALHEFLYLDLKQGYDIGEITVEDDGDRRPFTDLTGEVIVRPSLRTNVSARWKYDVYDKWLESYDVTAYWADRRGDAVSGTYRFIRDSDEYLESKVKVHLFKPLYLTYGLRFSLIDDSVLENKYGIKWKSQCWAAKLTFTEKLEERIVYLTIDLTGIGRVVSAETIFDEGQ